MSLPIWNHLCQQPPILLATFTEKHVKIVHDSTTQLHQSPDSILSTLNRRAIALTDLANFESAVHDAKLMQQLSPSTALGYIREATIYNEQGKQRDVIDICNMGLSMVDTNDPGYSTLQQAKATAEQQDKIRIDFVSQLPADLVMATLVPMLMGYYISSTNPCPYLDVSTIWRDRIIQSPYGLRFRIEFEEEQEYSLKVVRFAQYIKMLDINTYSKGAWLCDLLQDNNFCSLREMYIRNIRTSPIAPFVSALKSISSTLAKLTLEIHPGYGFSVADVVFACPNLESLIVRNPQDADFSSLPMTISTKMKNLSIIKSAQNVSIDQVVTISKLFPSLKKLTLSPCIDLQPALVVSDYFPSMKNLDCFIFDGVEMTFSDDGGYDDEEQQQQMITNISLRCVPCPSYNKHDLSRILKKHRGTLVELSMAMESDYNKPEDLWGMQYPRLRRLILDTSGWWIPRNAPLLEELSLPIDDSNPADKVFETIPPKLKKLEMFLYRTSAGDHPAVARSFHCLAQQTQLTHLDIFFGSRKRNYDSIIDAICQLHQLQHLNINFDLDWKPKDQEGCFVKIAKQCSNLKYLVIQSCTAPSAHTLHALNQLEHLEQLSFSMAGADKQEGFWKAVGSLTRSLWIKLFHKSPVHDLEIKALTQCRPDMRITVCKY